MPDIHCARIDRHEPHETRQAWGWGLRVFRCDGQPVTEGGAEQAERCEDCDKRLLPDNRAVTCWAHRLCRDCEPHRTDRCSSCDYERAKASWPSAF